MPFPDDLDLAEQLLAQGICTRAQVDECLDIVRRLHEDGRGAIPRLSDLLARRAYLRPEFLFKKYIRISPLGSRGWKAWDGHLHRWVALTFPESELPRMDHPNVPAIYETGHHQDRFYAVRQFVEGRTLEGIDRDNRRRLVLWVRDASLAVQAAHDQEIFHGALKPANLIVDRVNQVFVLNFTGGDRSSDVLGLGTTLRDVLCGPHPAPLPKDLDLIVRKSTEADPASRYGTARELSEDLDRWLNGSSVRTQPTPARYAVVAAVLLLISLGVFFFSGTGKEASSGELTALWSQIVQEKQRLHVQDNDPATVREALEKLIVRLDDYIRRHPGRPEGYFIRARARLYLNNFPECDTDLKRALDANPDFTPARALLIWSRLLQSQSVQAKEFFGVESGTWGPVETREDRILTLLISAGRESFLNGNDPRARDLLLKADIREPSAEACWLMGTLQPDLKTRASWFRKAVAHMPHFGPAWISLGEVQMAQEKFVAAERAFTRAIACDAGLDQAWFDRSRCRIRIGNYRGAILDCDTIIGRFPRREPVLYHRGVAKFHDGDIAGAETDLLAAETGEAADFPVLVMLATLRAAQGDDPATIRYCSKALEWNVQSPDLYFKRAAAHLRLGNFHQAEEDYSTALGYEPKRSDALAGRARVRLRQGRHREAVRDATEALKLESARAEAWLYRGMARSQLNDHPGAIEDFTEVIRLGVFLSEAHFHRGSAHLRLRRHAKAIADFDLAIRFDPGRHEAWVGKGVAHAGVGRYEDARNCYTEALKIEPRSANALHKRGLIHEEMGERKAAASDYRRALEVAPEGWREAERVRAWLENNR